MFISFSKLVKFKTKLHNNPFKQPSKKVALKYFVKVLGTPVPANQRLNNK